MKGQMEMIGLAFVVVLMVLGLLLYVALTATSGANRGDDIREADRLGKALETAMLETEVPACGYSLATALERCVTNQKALCREQGAFRNVCDAARDSWDDMLASSLGDETTDTAVSYYAYVNVNNDQILRDFEKQPFDDCNAKTNSTLAAPAQPIHTGAGDLRFVIQFC